MIQAVKDAGIEKIYIVAGENITAIKDYINGREIQLFRTADDATACFEDELIVFLSGDKPFIDADSIKGAIEMHKNNPFCMTAISEKYVGCCISAGLIGKSGVRTKIFTSANKNITLSADSYADLSRLNETMRLLILERHINNDVDIPCIDGIIISPGCTIGSGTTILPNTIIKDNTSIGENCILGPDSYIENAEIGNAVRFDNSQIRSAKILSDADIGPFVHIRPASVIGENVHLGNFVEVKNSVIDTSTKVSHLTYVGDSDVGRNVNFGCGVVTVNFTGKTKHRTTIRDGAFIGCNTNLIAPVTVGKNSYTAAGSTITQNVPDNSLAIAREKQINKEGWVKKNQPYRNKV